MAKSVKRVSKKAAKKSSKKRSYKSYKSYINKTLKQSSKGASLSGKAIKIVNSFVVDTLDKLAVQAAQVTRSNKRSTLGSKEIQAAVKLLLPAELAKHAMGEGAKAVAKASA